MLYRKTLLSCSSGPQLYLKETPTQVFSCEYCEIFKNTYFGEHLRTPAYLAYRIWTANNTFPMIFYLDFYSYECKFQVPLLGSFLAVATRNCIFCWCEPNLFSWSTFIIYTTTSSQLKTIRPLLKLIFLMTSTGKRSKSEKNAAYLK